jgi:dehydratase family protein
LETRFAGDPDILGKAIRINSESYQIVAVMPDVIPGWMDQTSAPISIWTPFAFADIWSEAARGGRGDSSLARLKRGVSYDRARSELAAMAADLAREHPIDQGIGATIEPLADTRAGSIRPILLMLAGAVGMVLLIACGFPEWGQIPMPRVLLNQGIDDIVRVSDARMSGTSFGTVVLHAAAESAIGGPLPAVRTGDQIELDVANRPIELCIGEEELQRRLTAFRPREPKYSRGYGRMFLEHVTQANEGCDFDFLRPG